MNDSKPHSAPNPARSRRRIALRLVWLKLVVVTCGWLAAGTAIAQGVADGDVINREYTLKALFLFNFGGYVEWPEAAHASPDSPFVIGVLGSADIDRTLREIEATKKIGGRAIVVQRFASVEAVKPCHILFISRDVQLHHQQQVLSKLAEHHVLLVGETPGFAQNGGAVNFFVEANKIRFEINLEAARQHQLKISSKLLALAKVVPN